MMELSDVSKLAFLYRFILLIQHMSLLLLIDLNGSKSLLAVEARSSSHYSGDVLACDRTIEEYLNKVARTNRVAIRGRAHDRFLFNWQTTTTLQRFNVTGSPDDDLKPRIDRHTSVQWLANKSGFDPNLRTVFVLHGFATLSLAQQRWANEIRNLIYRWKDSANMFYVDWNHKSNIIYPIYAGALNGAMDVADDLRQIISNLKLAFPQWDSSQIHLVGHSLGSHISGRLGYMMKGEIKQITAMDPPDTLQDDWPAETRLTSDDGQFVISYVTDGYGLGSRLNSADVVLRPNGGYRQPGCVSMMCRHMRSAYYNSHNMGKCIMVGYRADSYEQFSRGQVGYCAEDSDACVGVGNWWQYDEGLQMSEKHFRPGPNWRSRRQTTNSSGPVKWTPQNRAYYVKLADDEPWCIFTYQVAVGFENISNDDKLRYIDKLYISLRSPNSTTADNDIRVKLVKFSPPSSGFNEDSLGPNVFTKSALRYGKSDGNERRARHRNRNRNRSTSRMERIRMRGGHERTGSNYTTLVYAGLALIEPTHQLYNLMPLKFTEATVWLPGRNAFGGKLVGQSEQPQVYVNFMSDNRFERRQQYSGQLEEVYWFPPSRR